MSLTSLSAARSVLHGRYAEASLGGTLIALLKDWEVTVETDVVDVTAHSDVWKVFDALDSGWTFRAKSYVVPASAAHIINQLYSSGALPPAITVAGYSGSVASGTKIFQGSGIPIRASLAAPMELAEQEFEVRGTGAPTTGV
jgi:hypothetical protein